MKQDWICVNLCHDGMKYYYVLFIILNHFIYNQIRLFLNDFLDILNYTFISEKL